MKEYIERKAATVYAPLPKHQREYTTLNLDDAWEDGYDYALSQVKSIPAADVRPVVRGRWEKCVGENGVTSACRCSLCGFEDNRFSMFNYCPNCGADMRGAE